MNFTGSYWNPANPGWGIDIFEAADGKVVAHYFGYDTLDNQMWLVGVGQRSGASVVLSCFSTLKTAGVVAETPWGKITVSETGGLHAAFNPTIGTPSIEPLQSILTPAASSPQIIIRNKHGHDTGVPCEGGTMNLPDELSIQVLSGSLHITDTYAQGPWNPKLTGVKKLDILTAGHTYTVQCTADAEAQPIAGTWVQANWGVKTAELGQIIKVSAQVKG